LSSLVPSVQMAWRHPRTAPPQTSQRRAPRAVAAVLLSAAAAAPATVVAEGACATAALGCASYGGGAGAYAWPQKGGNLTSGAALHSGPGKVGHDTVKWVWPNPDDELMRIGPLIDDSDNVYLLTVSGWVRKFDAQGGLIWSFRTAPLEGQLSTPGVLYQGRLHVASYGMSIGTASRGYLFSISMETGDINWRVQLPTGSSHGRGVVEHSGGLVVHNGTLFTALHHHANPLQVNNMIVAFSVEDGRLLWEFVMEPIIVNPDRTIPAFVHNFQPSFPGDGTMLFSTPSARAYRLSLDDGSIIWQAAYEEMYWLYDFNDWRMTGGGTLSPRGDTFFALGNYLAVVSSPEVNDPVPFEGVSPCMLYGQCEFGAALLVAYDVEDGEILWHRRFQPGLFGSSYPAVGRVQGLGDHPALVLPLGVNAERLTLYRGPTVLPGFFRRWLAQRQFDSPWLRRMLGMEERQNMIVVVNMTTGHEIWRIEEPPWQHFSAIGEESGLNTRVDALIGGDVRKEVICQPDSWGSPVIGADGTIYAASGLSGTLYAIRDQDGNGAITEGEVSIFFAGQAFAHSPALGRGILAAAPCWGPMYVFG